MGKPIGVVKQVEPWPRSTGHVEKTDFMVLPRRRAIQSLGTPGLSVRAGLDPSKLSYYSKARVRKLRSLSDLGDRRERSGRASAFFRSLEAHSGDYGTRESGKRGRSPTRAVDQSQVRQAPSPNFSRICTDLAGLLVPQGIFPQSAVITDTPLLRKSPCETNILRDIGTNS